MNRFSRLDEAVSMVGELILDSEFSRARFVVHYEPISFGSSGKRNLVGAGLGVHYEQVRSLRVKRRNLPSGIDFQLRIILIAHTG